MQILPIKKNETEDYKILSRFIFSKTTKTVNKIMVMELTYSLQRTVVFFFFLGRGYGQATKEVKRGEDRAVQSNGSALS